MLKNAVADALVRQFGSKVKVNLNSRDFAVFEAAHPEVGNVTIEEDGNEMIVSVGNLTHGHFGIYEPDLGVEEQETYIAESVIDFLVDLFDDKFYLFSSAGSGGWARSDFVKESDMLSPNTRWYKWSGPVTRKLET